LFPDAYGVGFDTAKVFDIPYGKAFIAGKLRDFPEFPGAKSGDGL